MDLPPSGHRARLSEFALGVGKGAPRSCEGIFGGCKAVSDANETARGWALPRRYSNPEARGPRGVRAAKTRTE